MRIKISNADIDSWMDKIQIDIWKRKGSMIYGRTRIGKDAISYWRDSVASEEEEQRIIERERRSAAALLAARKLTNKDWPVIIYSEDGWEAEVVEKETNL